MLRRIQTLFQAIITNPSGVFDTFEDNDNEEWLLGLLPLGACIITLLFTVPPILTALVVIGVVVTAKKWDEEYYNLNYKEDDPDEEDIDIM